jgi:hypothetical protein
MLGRDRALRSPPRAGPDLPSPTTLEIGPQYQTELWYWVGGAKHGDMETTPRHREVRVRN